MEVILIQIQLSNFCMFGAWEKDEKECIVEFRLTGCVKLWAKLSMSRTAVSGRKSSDI